jgi:hypothetical protein
VGPLRAIGSTLGLGTLSSNVSPALPLGFLKHVGSTDASSLRLSGCEGGPEVTPTGCEVNFHARMMNVRQDAIEDRKVITLTS